MGLGSTKDDVAWVNIWQDPDAAAYVTTHRDGNETVPTAVTGAGPFTVEFGAEAPGPREYLVYAGGAVGTPTGIRDAARGALRDPATRAGWLAVVPAGWEQTHPIEPALSSLLLQVNGVVEHVFDQLRETLYITTSSGFLERYDFRLNMWLEPWARMNGFELLCTQAEWTTDGKYSGQFATPNCHGPEKVRRLMEVVEPGEYEAVLAFGDSSGDKEMLALASEAHFKPFRVEGK